MNEQSISIETQSGFCRQAAEDAIESVLHATKPHFLREQFPGIVTFARLDDIDWQEAAHRISHGCQMGIRCIFDVTFVNLHEMDVAATGIAFEVECTAGAEHGMSAFGFKVGPQSTRNLITPVPRPTAYESDWIVTMCRETTKTFQSAVQVRASDITQANALAIAAARAGEAKWLPGPEATKPPMLGYAWRAPAAPKPEPPAPPSVIDEELRARMIRAMSESKAKDGEGGFESLGDLLGFSGENKTRTVLAAALEAALAVARGDTRAG